MAPRSSRGSATIVAGVAAGAFAAGRLAGTPQLRFARMSGSSIAGRDAVGWVTDFLNAAYYRRPRGHRHVEDLRLAVAVMNTRWHQNGYRRLRATDVVAFHRAFGRDRLWGGNSPRGTLSHDQLLAGAGRLLGPWFAEAYADPERRAWGIAFETVAARDAYRPEERLRLAALGPPTPPSEPTGDQMWHTYAPVEVPSAASVVAAVIRPETWPDYATEVGRFTPLRAGGLSGQTFEIEVMAAVTPWTPAFLRGYVTISRLVTPDDPDALHAYMDDLNTAMRRWGRGEPDPLPEGATPVVGFDLTTHEGHFMGCSRNRLILFEQDGRAYLRAAGTWDPMPWHLDQAYRRAGRDAQHAFWGMGSPEQSMLHQIAIAAGRQ